MNSDSETILSFTHGQWTCEQSFFQKQWPIWADGLNKLQCIWFISSLGISLKCCHSVSLVHDVPLINNYVYKVSIDLQHFKGTFICDWDMSLGCKRISHHASVFRGCTICTQCG